MVLGERCFKGRRDRSQEGGAVRDTERQVETRKEKWRQGPRGENGGEHTTHIQSITHTVVTYARENTQSATQ